MNIRAEPDKAAQVQREAQAWLRRLTSGEATQRDLEGLRRWQEASELHAQAFAEAKRLWKTLDPAIGQMMEAQPALLSDHRESMRQKAQSPRLARRAFLGAAVSAAGVAAAVYPPLALWPSVSEWSADFHTATGEQRSVVLAEGVGLVLNTQTSAQRQTRDGRTVGIDLISGEAAVDLSPASGASAFRVVAGAGRSDAQSGRFEVRHIDGSTCVTCIEGSVSVTHARGARTLQAGQQVVYDAGSIGGATGVQGTDVSAWRSGVLVFRQTPLAHVIAEINRYRPGRVVLLARALADRPVSGRFAIASLDTVLVQIQRSYDLEARTLPGRVLVLS